MSIRSTLCMSALVLAWAVAKAPAQPANVPPTSLWPERFDYRDDHDGRRLADIGLQTADREGARVLEMVVTAVGPLVDPIPGWMGVPGANRHTAEQLDNIVTGRFSFAVKTYAPGSSLPFAGSWRAGKSGPIPQRSLGPDGRIDFLSMTQREYPLELLVEAGAATPGRHAILLWFNGAPRLRIVCVVSGDSAKIVHLESLAAAPASALAETDIGQPVKEKFTTVSINDAEWKERDLEGKWVLFKKLTRGEDKLGKALVRQLAARKEHELLELIALYEPFFGGGLAAAQALAHADAPQWLRVAAWLRRSNASHGEAEVTEILVKQNPAKALAWLEAHPDQARLVLNELATLRARKVKPGDFEAALPPLAQADVFRFLDAPGELAVFGERRQAEKGMVYVHQVQRTLNGFVNAGLYAEPWLSQVVKLTRHAQTEVRQAAYLACTYFAHHLDARKGAADEFRRVLDDPKESAAIREAALMAFDACRHPQVYVRLHELALETTHPAWRAAVSCACGQGNEFTLEHLKRIDKAKLPAKDALVLEEHYRSFKQGMDDTRRTRTISDSHLESLLERAAWAEHEKSPLAASLTRWTRTFLASRRTEELDKQLSHLQYTYVPAWPLSDPGAFSRRVCGLAEAIRSEAPPRDR